MTDEELNQQFEQVKEEVHWHTNIALFAIIAWTMFMSALTVLVIVRYLR